MRNETFEGYVNLNDNDKYQPIYASQLYGTFFSVFAKLTTDGTNKDYYVIKKIDLKLVIYKGIIDIGITQAAFETESQKNKLGEIVKINPTINMEVQALYDSEPKDLIVSNIDPTFKFYKNKDFLRVERKLKRMHGDNRAIKNGIFDTEFYYREGPLTSEEKYPKVCPKPDEWGELTQIHPEGYIGKCPRSKLKVI